MPEKYPHAALAVGLDGRQVVFVLQFGRQRIVERNGRFAQASPVESRDGDLPPLVEPRPFLFESEAVVLAPQGSAFAPGGPQPVVGVAGQGDVRFELGGVGQRNDVLPACAVMAAQQDVVIALVVGVPGGIDVAAGVGGDRGLPVVGLRRGDFFRGRPPFAVVEAREDVGLTVAEALPDDPDAALRVGCEVVVKIGLRGFAEPLDGRPALAVEDAGVEVAVAVRLV